MFPFRVYSRKKVGQEEAARSGSVDSFVLLIKKPEAKDSARINQKNLRLCHDKLRLTVSKVMTRENGNGSSKVFFAFMPDFIHK